MEEGGIIVAAVAQAWIHISMTFFYILLSTPNKAAEFFPIILRRKKETISVKVLFFLQEKTIQLLLCSFLVAYNVSAVSLLCSNFNFIT